LLIVGKPLNQKIAKEINSVVDNRITTVLEFIPDDDIQIYMNAADVVILPYTDILTSGAAILAMSFGKPVIAPAVKCITETIDDKGGFVGSGSVSNGLP
jgi:glycosyltransferase involved in cell wall biosynthesis